MSDELKPCPFCKCKPDGYEGQQVSCRCGAMGPIETQGDPESAAWNTHADHIQELEAKLQKWVGVLEWLDDDTITRVDWAAGGGDPAGEFCRLGLSRTMPDGTELFRTYVAVDEWTPRRPNPFGLGIDGGDA